jgi:hypothetical protein
VSHIVDKPILVDQLKPDLGAKIVKLIIDDNERARRARERRREKREQREQKKQR